MKRVIITLTIFLITIVGFSQERNNSIDTIISTKDSTVIFVQEYIDSVIMKSYYGIYTDSTDTEFRFGFLKLKKGIMREYKIGLKWDEKEYNWRSYYPGYRDHDLELIIMRRIK